MKRFIHIFIVIAVLISNISLALALENTDSSHLCDSSHNHTISEDINNLEIQPLAIACPKCSNGYVTNITKVRKDAETHWGPHGSCKLNYEHAYTWKYDQIYEECSSCSYSKLLYTGSGYGYKCIPR